MPAPSRRRFSEPKLIALSLGAAAVMVICIIGLIENADIWLGLVTLAAMATIALAIVAELRGVIGDSTGDPEPAPAPPGRTVVVCTAAMSADQVLEAVGDAGGDHRSIMVVAPEGLGTGGLMVDERDYARALRAETATVAALRRAGHNAAGHVGDRNPEHAVVDALALFPATSVVVVADAGELDAYRRHLDCEALERRTGAHIRVLETVPR
jgi:hypothetical protein